MNINDWLVPGAAKDPQSVTPNWERLDPCLIDGVVLKDVRHVPTSYGHLTELFRKDWELTGSRKNSKTYGMLNEFKLGDARPGLLIVPPCVWHGVHNTSSSDSSLINFVDHAYSYEDPDHWRLAADSPEIPYSFKTASADPRNVAVNPSHTTR